MSAHNIIFFFFWLRTILNRTTCHVGYEVSMTNNNDLRLRIYLFVDYPNYRFN